MAKANSHCNPSIKLIVHHKMREICSIFTNAQRKKRMLLLTENNWAEIILLSLPHNHNR